jgi:hypothetical protein
MMAAAYASLQWPHDLARSGSQPERTACQCARAGALFGRSDSGTWPRIGDTAQRTPARNTRLAALAKPHGHRESRARP